MDSGLFQPLTLSCAKDYWKFLFFLVFCERRNRTLFVLHFADNNWICSIGFGFTFAIELNASAKFTGNHFVISQIKNIAEPHTPVS